MTRGRRATRRAPLVVLAAALPIAAPPGCRTIGPADDAPSGPTDGRVPGGPSGGACAGIAAEIAPGLVLLHRGEARGEVAFEDLAPRKDTELRFRVLDPDARGSAPPRSTIEGDFIWRATPTDRFGAEMAVDEGPDQTLFIAGLDLAEPRMTASISHKDAAVSLFDPALVMGAGRLRSNEPVEGESAMIVQTTREPPKERDRGRATRRIVFAGVDTLSLPQGRFECQRVEIDFRATLRFAEATVRTTRWVIPGAGPVAEDRRERLVVMGIVPSESRRVMVRTTPIEEHAP